MSREVRRMCCVVRGVLNFERKTLPSLLHSQFGNSFTVDPARNRRPRADRRSPEGVVIDGKWGGGETPGAFRQKAANFAAE